jgi:hypothetical protein
MAPNALIRVIVHWQKVAADWTRLLLSLGMLGIDIDPLRHDIQVYLLNSLRLKAQKVTIQFGFDLPPFRGGVYQIRLVYPRETLMNQKALDVLSR